MSLFDKVNTILNEGLTNDIIKNTLARVLNVSKDDITVKRYSKDGAWITIEGYNRKLRAVGSNIYVGVLGFNIDSDYEMDGLADEMSRYKSESISEAEDPEIIDVENNSFENIKQWLDTYNDRKQYSDEFNKLWLEIYKYYEHNKLVNEAEMVSREAGEIDPERRANLVARLKKYWPRVPKAWIDARTDDYLEQVVTSYENRAAAKEAKKTEPKAEPVDKNKEAFKNKLGAMLKKGE